MKSGDPQTLTIGRGGPAASHRGWKEAAIANLASVGYQIIQSIGQGTAGTVFLARNAKGVDVAVKVLHPRLADDEVAVQRFLRESAVAKRITHPNLVHSLDAGECNGTYYLAMEYVKGETLAALLARKRKLPEEEAIRITIELASALQVAHKANLIHRDVKPANVLLSESGQPKLVDMGLVKDVGGTDITKPNQGLGTPIYMAPEQFLDAKQVDARCDIYSLGVLLYTATTGELPFPGPGLAQILDSKIRGEFIPPERFNPSLHSATLAAICCAMASDPDKRPATMSEFADMLRVTLEAKNVPAAHALAKDGAAAAPKTWFVLLSRGKKLTLVNATEDAIDRALAQGKLAFHFCASAERTGPFIPLALIPRFSGNGASD